MNEIILVILAIYVVPPRQGLLQLCLILLALGHAFLGLSKNF